MNSKQYNEKLKAKVAEAKKIHTFAEGEERDLTPDEVAAFDAIMADVDSLSQLIQKTTKLEQAEAAADAVEASLKQSAGRISRPEPIHADVERYSIVRALRTFTEKGRLDGLEAEVSDELAKKSGRSPQGFFLPLDMPIQKFGNLDKTTGAGGLNTTVDYSNFIDLLRNKMLVKQLGASVLSDLNGTVQIPKQTGGATAYWINADGSATITASNQTIGQVPLAPVTVGALTAYTRAFLKQTSMDVESFVQNDLATVVALEMDRVVFNGSGSGSEPEGILQNSSVETVALGADGDYPTFAKLVEMETAVAIANADIGKLAYVTTAAGRGVMKTTEVAENTARFIWENDQINGYAAYASNQLPSDLTKGAYGEDLSSIIYGNWADVLIGLWGGLDVVVNPYTGDAAGSVRITVMQDTDVAFRHVESFCKCVDLQTAA